MCAERETRSEFHGRGSSHFLLFSWHISSDPKIALSFLAVLLIITIQHRTANMRHDAVLKAGKDCPSSSVSSMNSLLRFKMVLLGSGNMKPNVLSPPTPI